jgi:Zn-dependent protease with chaperone function
MSTTSSLLDWLRLLPPAAVLATPVVATLLLRRRALRRGEEDPQAAWIAFSHAQQRLARGSWLAWFVIIPVCNANAVILRALSGLPLPVQFAADAAFFLLPAVARVVSTGLAYPVYARVRGANWTRADLVWQSIWGQMAFAAPIVFFAAGLGTLNARVEFQGSGTYHYQFQPFDNFAQRHPFDPHTERKVWAFFLVGGVVGVLSIFRRRHLQAAIRRAVGSGELRDRVFELAKDASVKLREVRVLRFTKVPIANAVAFRHQEIWLTDYLLTHLSCGEVDAIIAHELAHLRRNHLGKPRASYLSTFVCFAVTVAIVLGTTWPGADLGVDAGRWLPLAPVLMGVTVWLDVTRKRRRFELEADTDEVVLTGDPEACITALVKLDRLNWMPIKASVWRDWLSTHPSTQHRIERMARLGDITAERLQELVEAPQIDPRRYPLPAEAMGDTWVFSREFRRRLVKSQQLSSSAGRVLIPALTAAFLVPLATSWPGARAIAAAGVAATLFFCSLVINLQAAIAYARLERRWRKRLEKEGLVGIAGEFVGLFPGDAPRWYDGAADWDIGLLVRTADQLIYLGEKVRFALRRDQVDSATVGTAVPNWPPFTRLYIRWHDKDQATAGTFGIWTGPAFSAWQCRAATSRLAKRVRNWHEGSSLSLQGTTPAGLLSAPR